MISIKVLIKLKKKKLNLYLLNKN